MTNKFKAALEWIVRDAAYKAPEQMNEVAIRYVEFAQTALLVEKLRYKSTEHKERYLHLRDPQHGVIDYPGGWPLKHAQARTVFMREELPSALPNPIWYFSVADCSYKDQFDRRLGRLAARRRYFQGNCFIFSGTNYKFEEVARQALAIKLYMLEQIH